MGFIFGHLSRYFWPGTILGRLNLLDFMVAGAVIWATLSKSKQINYPKWLLSFGTILALSFFIGLSIVGWQNQPEAWLYLVRFAFYLLFIIFMPTIFSKNGYQLGAWIGTATALLGFLQLKIWPTIPISMIATHGFDPHVNRLFATWFDPNLVASILLVTTIITLAWWQQKKEPVWLISFGLQVVALLLTQSRSGLLGLMVALFFYLLYMDKKKILLLLSLLMMTLLFSPSLANRLKSGLSLDSTAIARLVSWREAGMIINTSPVIGVGYNNYQAGAAALGKQKQPFGTINLAANASDSSLLTLWASTGFFGLLAWLGWMLSEAIRPRLVKAQKGAAIAVTAGILVNSLFINSLLFVFVLVLLAIVYYPEAKESS